MDNEINTNNSQDVQQAVTDALKNEKKKKKKKRIIIISIIVAILLIIAVASSSGGSDNGAENNNNNVEVSDNANSNEENNSPKNSVEAGNSVETKYLKISYLSCNSDFKNYNKYSAPAEGNKVVCAEFEFENISSTDQFLSSIECYADNKKCESYYGVDDAHSFVLESISPNRSISGTIYFEVPKNAEVIELEVEGDSWSNEKITFVIK